MRVQVGEGSQGWIKHLDSSLFKSSDFLLQVTASLVRSFQQGKNTTGLALWKKHREKKDRLERRRRVETR